AALEEVPDTTLLATSSLYQSPPMGPQDQPDYINAVAKIDSQLEPLQLLQQLQQIEQQQGRVRKRHWGERTIDLDLLLYGDEVIDHPQLQLPHPGIAERVFVLLPLAELSGKGLQLPGMGPLGKWLKQCDCSEIVKVEE
ncbi:MAG: 2-amino-4-hydroxy-6-hydroxymethyldihydropteridine diphosphokinase, partial [Gammaproteobacteria bacterium]|nr:2-amino-4-hydroxy-6-hydroxymethyldihydropteridine diphosphokinase [Gammaproteobacteria bacterium]